MPDAGGAEAARALFARVLDLPGGMRIGTIHAFCQSLLRRFPLEARCRRISCWSSDIDAAVALREARGGDAGGSAHRTHARAALADLAGLVRLEQFGELVTRSRQSEPRPA